MNKETKIKLIQLGLFLLTCFTTTLAGAEWSLNKFVFFGLSWSDFKYGLNFSIPFLAILTVHEFGHYFTAKWHRIKVTLPYYIPFWFGFIGTPSIGTMGAFIRIKEHIGSRIKYFDVGVSGPIAGFVITVFVLWYGFSHLPPQEYIYEIHPEYLEYETIEEAVEASDGMQLKLGSSLLFDFFKNAVADPERIPHESELYHYPWLLAGYLALFFTAINLLPIGQLDGGHILFGIVGAGNHKIISRSLFTIMLFFMGLGWVDIYDLADTSPDGIGDFLFQIATYLLLLYISAHSMFKKKQNRLMYATILLTVQYSVSSIFPVEGYPGWLLFGVLIGRFLGVDHPSVYDSRDIGTTRKIIGIAALVIFILCFSPRPFIVSGI